MDEAKAETKVVKANAEKGGRTATPTPTSSTGSSPDRSLVLGLQAANTSMHALDEANRELIEALEEAQGEIHRYVNFIEI